MENNNYDEYMDEDCIKICHAINEIPKCHTTSSCCGHLKENFKIFASTYDVYALSILSRSFDRRYSGTSQVWKIELVTSDGGYPKFSLYIHSENKYNDYETMKKDINTLSENIKYWLNERFIEHFFNE